MHLRCKKLCLKGDANYKHVTYCVAVSRHFKEYGKRTYWKLLPKIYEQQNYSIVFLNILPKENKRKLTKQYVFITFPTDRLTKKLKQHHQ